MSVSVQSCALFGIEVRPITVEVDLLARLPRVCIVGLPAAAVQETAERVRSAIAASGFEFPRQRIVVNLAPADVRKDGTSMDVAIAVGILAASGQYTPPEGAVFLGELGLDGSIRPVRADYAAIKTYGIRLHGPEFATLRDLVANVTKYTSSMAPPVPSTSRVDYSEVRGSQDAIPALIEAARTGRPLILVGGPGSGKSMIARRFAGLLPDITPAECVELAKIYAAAGFDGAMPQRPFRAPHHSITVAGLLGGRHLRPGEVTLAHNGVLFLDEANEFSRATLEMLRAPMEQGTVTVREFGLSMESATMPARFHLILAVNDEERLARVQSCMPFLKDAIILRLSPVPPSEVLTSSPWPSTAQLRGRVMEAQPDGRRAWLDHLANVGLPFDSEGDSE